MLSLSVQSWAANPVQAMSEDSKSYFECSIWILTVKCNAHNFSQYYNFQNQKITMLENIRYIIELTAWHFYQGHVSGACVWREGNRSHFFRLTYSTKFSKVNTRWPIQRVNSTHWTNMKGANFGSSTSKTRKPYVTGNPAYSVSVSYIWAWNAT